MNILKTIAKNNGVSVAEVEQEIHFAILAAMGSSEKGSGDNWDKLFPNGEMPTPKQLIKKLSAEVIQ